MGMEKEKYGVKKERKIYIKPIFGGWREATEERARIYARYKLETTTNVPLEKRRQYINKNALKGTTCEELGV